MNKHQCKGEAKYPKMVANKLTSVWDSGCGTVTSDTQGEQMLE